VSRELSLVELVDPAGVPVGTATVAEAHAAPGQLHRAFSVMLVDAAGRVLLQRRAAVKTRFPLRWANACCGHPDPGADLPAAAAKRLREELGLERVTLEPVGVYVYRALDPVSERVEHEYDHVLVGQLDGEAPDPDPAEVAALRWAYPDDLHRAIATEPWSYAPWLAGVVAVWHAAAESPGE
jgi:isopentenyl-diphosphate Delta-isomerase